MRCAEQKNFARTAFPRPIKKSVSSEAPATSFEEAFFRQISESMIDLIAVIDRHGNRIYNSPSYREVLMRDPAELTGSDSFEEIHPDDRAKVKRIFRKTLATGVGQRAEFRFLLTDGSIRHIESQGSVIRDRSGKPSRVVVVSRDITERKKLEEQTLEILEKAQRRIGHDFYERLGQDLTGVGFMSKILEETLAEKCLPEAGQAADIVKFVAEAVSQTRHLSTGLLALDLQVNGLSPALSELTVKLSKIFNVACISRCDKNLAIHDPRVSLNLYHITEAAMSDAIKIRKATRVFVALTSKDNKVTLTITDNGMDARGSSKGKASLHLMKYRAHAVGIALAVRKMIEGGRTITCSLANNPPPVRR